MALTKCKILLYVKIFVLISSPWSDMVKINYECKALFNLEFEILS